MALSRVDVVAIHVVVLMLCPEEVVEGSWDPVRFAGVLRAAVVL